MQNDCGISEILGTILLILVITLVIGTATVMWLSQEPAEELPDLLPVITNVSSIVCIEHAGGDSLEKGEVLVRVNDADVSDQIIFEGDSWDIGEKLVYDSPVPVRNVQLIYMGAGRSDLLASLSGDDIRPTFTIPPVTPTQTTTPIPTHTQPLIQADFSALPVDGTAPLEVQFTDQSAGEISSYHWEFGDGEISDEENPSHLYADPGIYTVTLRVSDGLRHSSLTRTAYITVRAMSWMDTELITNSYKSGTLLSGGYLEFTSLSPGARIKIGKSWVYPDENDRVRFEISEDTNKGKLYLHNSAIWSGGIGVPVNLYINGDYAGSGRCKPHIPSYEDLESTLELRVSSETAWTELTVDGVSIVAESTDRGIHLYNLMPGNDNELNLNLKGGNSVYFRGSVSDYDLS